jgi:tetratricopeptide (TPR) repeat protein
MNTDSTYVYALAVGEAESRMHMKAPRGRRLLIPETIRALGEVILPVLLDDPEIQAFGYPERSCRRKFDSTDKSLALSVIRVLLDPYSVAARMKLGEAFEAEGLPDLAAEQFAFVADSAQDYVPGVIRAARLFSHLNRTEDALEMANRALVLDPDLAEAKNIAQEAISLQVVTNTHT